MGHDAYCENGDCRVVLFHVYEAGSNNCPGCGRMGRLKDEPSKDDGPAF